MEDVTERNTHKAYSKIHWLCRCVPEPLLVSSGLIVPNLCLSWLTVTLLGNFLLLYKNGGPKLKRQTISDMTDKLIQIKW